MDEHPDSINDGRFSLDPGLNSWIDLPASYHNGACGIAFADNHSFIKNWRSPSTRSPVLFESYSLRRGKVIPKSEEADFLWMRATYTGTY
jgi:prepilin-type processing-associated H-X9-DG protein